jgi:hypothetical protein
VARLTVNVMTRVEHVVLARVNAFAASSFGTPIASDKCYSCHRKTMASTFVDTQLKIRVSHEEPLAAGAQCVDCHALSSGTVTAVTVGMSPCLRCHDGKKAKADCSVCHLGDPSQSIRPDIDPAEMAAIQVPNPECGGCHKDMTKCNECHGIEMPHPSIFKAYGHARDGAIDVWENGQRTCKRCHYQGHNDCRQAGCHIDTFPGHPIPQWQRIHGLTSWSSSSITCSCHQWNPYDHNGMIFCEICHETRPRGSRP